MATDRGVWAKRHLGCPQHPHAPHHAACSSRALKHARAVATPAPPSPAQVHARTSSQLHEVGARGLPGAEDWAALQQANQLDMQLYRFGALLALLDSVVFDIAREAGLGAGYTALGRAGGAAGGGGGGSGLQASDQAHPGDDENWEVVGGANVTQRSCGFVSEYETDRVVPAHIVIR